MTQFEMEMDKAVDVINNYFRRLCGGINHDETRMYDCGGMPVELTIPVHGVPLKGCRSEE